jgi:transcriptional regulator with XRE-family HTH domain
VNGEELRREMRRLGLTGAALARRAGVSTATVSHAINGRRLHPDKLGAIRAALNGMKPMPGLDRLVRPDTQEHRA